MESILAFFHTPIDRADDRPLTKKLVELEAIIRQLQQGCTRHRSEHEKDEDALREAEKELEQIKGGDKDWKLEMSEALAKIKEEYDEALAKLKEEYELSVKKVTNKRMEELSQMTRTADEHKLEASRLKEDNQKLRNKVDRVNKLADELIKAADEQKVEVNRTKSENEQLQNQVKDLTKMAEEATRVKEENEKLSKKVKDLTKTVGQLTKELEVYKKDTKPDSNDKNYKTELINLERQLNEVFEELQKENERAEAKEEELGKVKEELEREKERANEAEKQVDFERKSREKNDAKVAEVENRLRQTERELAKEIELCDTVQNELCSAKQQLEMEKERLSEALKETDVEKRRRESIEIKLAEVEKRLREVESQLSEESKRFVAKEKELNDAKFELEKEKDRLNEATRQVDGERKGRRDTETKLADVEKRLREATNKLEAEKDSRREVERKLADVEWRLKEATQQLVDEKERCTDTEKQLDEVMRQLGSGKQQLKKTLEELERMKERHVSNALPGVIMPQRNYIYGVTSLADDVFVTRYSVKEVEVYNASTLTLKRRMPVPGLGSLPYGLVACASNKCLYVSDWENDTVHRVELGCNHTAMKWSMMWSVGSDDGPVRPAGLSVNSAHNVLVACCEANKIQEYSTCYTHATLVREVGLDTVGELWHAVQLFSGQFVVTHQKPVENVSVVGEDGRAVVSYTKSLNSEVGEMNCPRTLTVTRNGCVLVADELNNRILALNPSLTSAQVLPLKSPLSADGGLQWPWGLCLDESRGRLYVGEYDGGHVLVFDTEELDLTVN